MKQLELIDWTAVSMNFNVSIGFSRWNPWDPKKQPSPPLQVLEGQFFTIWSPISWHSNGEGSKFQLCYEPLPLYSDGLILSPVEIRDCPPVEEALPGAWPEIHSLIQDIWVILSNRGIGRNQGFRKMVVLSLIFKKTSKNQECRERTKSMSYVSRFVWWCLGNRDVLAKVLLSI